MASANSSTSRRISALLLSGNGKGSLIGAFEDAERDAQGIVDDEDSESSEDEDEEAEAFGFEAVAIPAEVEVPVEILNVAFEDAPVAVRPLLFVERAT